MKRTVALLMVLVLSLAMLVGCAPKEEEQNEVAKGPYEDKTAVFVGDSITAGRGLEDESNKYWLKVADALKFSSVQGFGISGSCVSTASTRGTQYSPLTTRLDTIPEADLIFILMGINDFCCDTPLGTPDSKEDTSFYGGWSVTLTYLKEKYPDSKIILITPIQCHMLSQNKLGMTQWDYVQIVKDVGRRHEVAVIDLCTLTLNDFTAKNRFDNMPDAIHPNDVGHELMANAIQTWLEENVDLVFPK